MASASRENNSSAGALETEQLKMDHRVTAQSPPSDNDSGERPVRQQLKATKLDSVGEKDGSARANRKRSLDNTDGATDTPPTKRSRECTPDNATEHNSNHARIPEDATTQDNLEMTAGGNEDESSQTLNKKRSREELEDGASKNSYIATEPAPGLTETTSDEKSTAEGQPEKKRPRDNSEERKAKVDQTFTASAFGMAAAANAPSPFAMPATKLTSETSPFATSGASTSGFGTLGSGFSAFGSAFPALSGKLTSFASPNAPSAFPGTAGKLASFASANTPTSFSGASGKLTSFVSPNAPVSFGESSDKTLGAKQSDNEDSDNEPVGETDDTFVAEKTDKRFHAQTVETGEENESTEFTAKAKLYYFDDKKWKERGTGTFKVNLKTESNGKKSGRIIMRADGALRVMLNSAVWHSMPFGDAKSSRPTTRDIYLASNEDGKVVSLLLRLGNEKQSGELFDVLKDIMEQI
ncbi:Pleckstrin homology-like domain [Penicillium digitatum]|uniref:Pleckstrin homology-like domain n=1 Tax=Penicillium digitatum TaxID=36651 RepID=A0A7T7BM37_PENDI|nr:Pleckstrin homology-like domain [Penicillium digitatum]